MPLRRQIVDSLITAIRDGRLEGDEALPSSRSLAASLGVARSTIVACFLELEGDGWVETVPGSGTFVSTRLSPQRTPQKPHARETVEPGQFELRTGRVDPRLLCSRAWRAAWHQDFSSVYPSPPKGEPHLLDELARYLSSTRNVDAQAADLMVCTGMSEALLLLSLGLGWTGRTVIVEDPGYPRVSTTLRRLGAEVKTVDAENPDTMLDDLERLDVNPAAMYLTPNHQYPLGHRLNTAQRERLLAWAADAGCLLLEDDYDAEYRFGGPPPDTLCAQNSTSADVVYFGTLSKVLDPGLRLAYLRLPPSVHTAVQAAREDLGATSARAVQLVVARLLRSGEVSRHTAKLRRVYGDRRKALLAALDPLPAVMNVRNEVAGLHLVVTLAPTVRSSAVVTQGASQGLLINDLDYYRAAPQLDHPELVLGFARLNPTELRTAVATLAQLPAINPLR